MFGWIGNWFAPKEPVPEPIVPKHLYVLGGSLMEIRNKAVLDWGWRFMPGWYDTMIGDRYINTDQENVEAITDATRLLRFKNARIFVAPGWQNALRASGVSLGALRKCGHEIIQLHT